MGFLRASHPQAANVRERWAWASLAEIPELWPQSLADRPGHGPAIWLTESLCRSRVVPHKSARERDLVRSALASQPENAGRARAELRLRQRTATPGAMLLHVGGA